jgi:hypothetical protein
MEVAFPGRVGEYRAGRDRLLEQEIKLRCSGWPSLWLLFG